MHIKMKDGLASLTVRLILGLIFVVAGIEKALDVRLFLFTVQQLDVFPAPVILPAVIVVIAWEISVGLAMLLGFYTRIAAGLLAALLLSFIAVISLALIHDKTVDCGCFGSAVSEHLGLGVILRDILLMIGCVWLIARNDTKVKRMS